MSDLNSEITEWISIAKGDKCPLCKGTGKIRGGQVTCPKCGGKKAVAKGDLPGHPFHGNQYQDGSGGSIPTGIHTINGKDVIIADRANLRNANLTHANLQDAHLSVANMGGANLGGANLNGVWLYRANLSSAYMVSAELHGANLRNAKLTSADLRGASLSSANLFRANLTGANLTNANLTNADLRGADLTNADLRGANLTNTKGDEKTKLPDTHEVVGGLVVARISKGDLPGDLFVKSAEIAKDADESLATILRHDEDHDNWHKMHGDEPCTSEADCAEKRAKYAEVKAELAKSADEILAEIEQWRIQKGDVPGHAFHGNQWTAVVDAQSELFPASNLHLQHSDDNMPSAISAQHERAAELHIDQKNRLKELTQKAVDEGHPITANRLKEAMGAHADAALEHQNAAQVVFDKGVGKTVLTLLTVLVGQAVMQWRPLALP